MKNVLVVLSGPSGVGKGTVAKRLIEESSNMLLSISCTTRSPRIGEEHGREYFFIDKSEFIKKLNEEGFLEYSEHFENYYGTPKDFVMKSLENSDVLLEIDVVGGLKVKENYKDALLIMLLPPSTEEIRKRLIKRNTESEEKIDLRMSRMEFELSKKDSYDYRVVNDDLDKTVQDILEIINQEKNRE